MERIQGKGWKGYRKNVGKDTGRRLERIQGDGYIEQIDTGRRLERIQGEGWIGYWKKVGNNTRRRMDRIQGEGWVGYREKVR